VCIVFPCVFLFVNAKGRPSALEPPTCEWVCSQHVVGGGGERVATTGSKIGEWWQQGKAPSLPRIEQLVNRGVA